MTLLKNAGGYIAMAGVCLAIVLIYGQTRETSGRKDERQKVNAEWTVQISQAKIETTLSHSVIVPPIQHMGEDLGGKGSRCAGIRQSNLKDSLSGGFRRIYYGDDKETFHSLDETPSGGYFNPDTNVCDAQATLLDSLGGKHEIGYHNYHIRETYTPPAFPFTERTITKTITAPSSDMLPSQWILGLSAEYQNGTGVGLLISKKPLFIMPRYYFESRTFGVGIGLMIEF